MTSRAMMLVLAMAMMGATGAQAQELDFHFAYRPAAFEALKANVQHVTIVSPEPFIVDGSGVVEGYLEPRLLELAREHGLKIMPQIKNVDRRVGLFSKEWAHSILNDERVRQRTIESMLEICRRYDLYGMQVDLEAIHIDDRDALTEFYREAAEALHAEGYRISIAVVHRAEESAGPNTYTKWMMEDWRGAFDLKALGEIGDFVKIMSYGQHTRRTTPGPVQGLPWLEDVLTYFLRYIPPEKLSLGITMSGSRWYTMAEPELHPIYGRTWSAGVTRPEAETLIDEYGGKLWWDDDQKVMMGYFDRGGVFEWVVIDNDLRSLDAKLELVRKYDIPAINMWVNGREDPGLWDRVANFRRTPAADQD